MPAIAVRNKLPARRVSRTTKASVGGRSLYLRTGDYPDGGLGEVFIDMHSGDETTRGLLNALAVSVSIGLQHGTPLSEYVDALCFTRFEPAGPVMGHDRIKMAHSLVDLIFRELGITYLGRDELAHTRSPAHVE